MKLTPILDEVLSEAKQVGIIYHYTDVFSLEDILTSKGLESHRSYEDLESVSFTRNKRFHVGYGENGYNARNGVGVNTRFTFDGNKLSDKYKLSPYAQPEFDKNKPQYFEAETRIVSDKKFYVPVKSPYLLRVDFKDVENTKRGTFTHRQYTELIKLLNKRGIKWGVLDKNGNGVPYKKSLLSKILGREL